MWSGESAKPAPDLEPFVVVQLEPGWRYDPESGTFLRREASEEEGTHDANVFDPTTKLPRATRIEPMIPHLFESAPEALSEPEAELARYLHLFPGPNADLDQLLEAVSGWTCVARAHKPPRIALP